MYPASRSSSSVFFPGIHTGASKFHNKCRGERKSRGWWACRPATTSATTAHSLIRKQVTLVHRPLWLSHKKKSREKRGGRSGHSHSTLLFSVQFVTDTLALSLRGFSHHHHGLILEESFETGNAVHRQTNRLGI